MSLKQEFLKLLEEDSEFRLAVAGMLGYSEILKRFEKHDRKFTTILKKMREHDKKFAEVFKRLEQHDRKFAEILDEIKKLREDFNKLSMRVEVTIGSMGRRWGFDLEKTVLEIFREALEKKGIEPGKVEKLRFVDKDGSITGVKGRRIDVDVLVKDEKLYIIEVKSRAELDHVEMLPIKVKAVEKYLGRRVDRSILVAVNVDKEAYERALELGIDVLCGNIIDSAGNS